MKNVPYRIAIGLLCILILHSGAYLLYQSLQSQHGLQAKYYANGNWSGKPSMVTSDPEISAWVVKKRVKNLTAREFSVEWNGALKVSRNAEYVLSSPGPSWIYVNQQPVIENATMKRSQGSIQLDAGEYPLRVLYRSDGAARMELQIAAQGESFRTVANEDLLPAAENPQRQMLRRMISIIGVSPVWVALEKRVDAASFYQSLLFYSLFVGLLLWFLGYFRPGRAGILALVFSLLFAVIVAEVALRTFFPYRFLQKFDGVPSHFYHHLYLPNRKMFVGFFDGIPVVVQTNEDGLRTLYSKKEYLKHQERIAVLGDSFVFGFGVRQEATFCKKMEEMLRAKGRDAAVLDAGVISYSPFLENLLFQGIVKQYHPTQVFLFLDVSDIGDDYRYAQEVVKDGSRPHFAWQDAPGTPYHGALIQLLKTNPWLWNSMSYPFDCLSRLIVGPEPAKTNYDYYKFYLNIDGVIERNRYFIYRHPLEKTKPFFEATLKNIQAVDQAVRASGASFSLVVFPRFTHWNPKECPGNWEAKAYTRNEPYQFEYFRFFEEKKPELSFPLYDLLSDFQHTKEFPLVLTNDPHWNERGHAFVARLMASRLGL